MTLKLQKSLILEHQIVILLDYLQTIKLLKLGVAIKELAVLSWYTIGLLSNGYAIFVIKFIIQIYSINGLF